MWNQLFAALKKLLFVNKNWPVIIANFLLPTVKGLNKINLIMGLTNKTN